MTGLEIGRPMLRVNWFEREPGGSTTYAAPVLRFRTSSRCSTGGCVEVAPLSGGVAIRSTRNQHLTLTFDAAGWAGFVAGVRAGQFD